MVEDCTVPRKCDVDDERIDGLREGNILEKGCEKLGQITEVHKINSLLRVSFPVKRAVCFTDRLIDQHTLPPVTMSSSLPHEASPCFLELYAPFMRTP